MKRIVFIVILQLWGCFLLSSFASPVVEDGVYSISCQQTDGYVALGAYHNVSPYICYVQDGQPMTEDAYWVVTNTADGYTFGGWYDGETKISDPTVLDNMYFKSASETVYKYDAAGTLLALATPIATLNKVIYQSEFSGNTAGNGGPPPRVFGMLSIVRMFSVTSSPSLPSPLVSACTMTPFS